MSSPPELTIVIAALEPSPSLVEGLDTLREQVRGRSCRILLAVPSAAEFAEVAAAGPVKVDLAAGKPGHLVPHLWGLGIEQAESRLVALTIGRCVPAADWIATILETDDRYPEAAGFGGPISPPVDGSSRDWAAYLMRYSGFLAVPEGETREIPGDNVVYRRADLERDWVDRQLGFWETTFHRRLRQRGRVIVFVRGLDVRLADSESALFFARLRVRHGRHYGSTRRLSSPVIRLAAALAAPAIAVTLLARICNRVLASRPEWRPRLWRAAPWLLFYLLAWSLGESWGYLTPRRSEPEGAADQGA